MIIWCIYIYIDTHTNDNIQAKRGAKQAHNQRHNLFKKGKQPIDALHVIIFPTSHVAIPTRNI